MVGDTAYDCRGLAHMAHWRIQRDVLNITGRFLSEFQSKLDPLRLSFPSSVSEKCIFFFPQALCLLRTDIDPGGIMQAILHPGDQRDYRVPKDMCHLGFRRVRDTAPMVRRVDYQYQRGFLFHTLI